HFKNIKGIPLFPKKGFYLFNSVNKWLKLIKNAEFIVTDSFHCTVFSVIFRKKFICLPNEKRGTTRLENFLRIIGESHRFIKNVNELDSAVILKDINYSKIELILKNEQEKSMKFLRNCF